MSSTFDGNPFADPEGANPFSDPSVTQHTAAAQKGLEDYNPFADEASGGGARKAAPEPTPSAPEPIVPKPAPPPAYEPAQLPPPGSQPATLDPGPVTYGEQFPGEAEPIVSREEEPQLPPPPGPAKSAVTAETPLTPAQQLELQLKEKNFPPCLRSKGCPIKPCFYHNIKLEIPQDRQKFVRLLYFYWYYIMFTLFFNFIASLAIFGNNSDTDNGVNFGFAILWFVAFVPCSFWCWYWCAYNAFKTDSSMRFMFFFFVFFFQFVSCAINAVGIPRSGAAGMINSLSAGKGVIIIGMISFCLWTVGAIISALLLIQIHRFYRTSGYSVAKAQTEAGTAIAKNEGVRNAVVAGVTSTAAP